jgi:hypothetical protein
MTKSELGPEYRNVPDVAKRIGVVLEEGKVKAVITGSA